MISLRSIAINFLVKRIELLNDLCEKYSFILPFSIADDLLGEVNNECIGISDRHVKIFTKMKCSLTRINIHCRKISNISSLSFLKEHHLQSIHIHHLTKFEIRDWLEYVDSTNLHDLSIKNCLLFRECKKPGYSYMEESCLINLRSCRNLKRLDVSMTDFDNGYFYIICKELLLLEDLNISQTYIQDFSYLISLKYLIEFNCSEMKNSCVTYEYLKNLNNLQSLTMSKFTNDVEMKLFNMDKFLYDNQWNNLINLKISGIWKLNKITIMHFIKKHQELKFLYFYKKKNEKSIFIQVKNQIFNFIPKVCFYLSN